MSLVINGSHSIAGQNRTAGTDPFHSINPRTGEQGTVMFSNAPSDLINEAVLAAQAAFAETRHYPATRFAELLDAIANEIEDLGDELLRVTDAETGLGIPRLTGERGRTTGQLRKFAELVREGSYVEAIIDTAQPERSPLPRPDIRRMQLPIGPVAVFSASNFPYAFAVAGGDTASAIAAGCPVVVKGHPSHPATSELFAHAINNAIEQTGFPKGFFSLIQGTQIEVGQTLVQHPGIQAVGFTGSLRGGRAIYNTAAARPTPIPVYAEMGSVNPIVILPSAIEQNPQTLAQNLTNSITLGTGQFCTNPGLIFMLDSEKTNSFIAHVTEEMQAKEPGVLLNPSIEKGLVQAVQGTAATDGVEVLTGGTALDTPACGYAHTVMQTTSAVFRAEAEALQVEHFGPVTLFVRCESTDDLLETLAILEGNLTATLHTTTTDPIAIDAFHILQEKVGRVIWNGFPTGVEVVYSMHHGGPYPATTAPSTTSVGMTAIKRFLRPVAFQGIPDMILPPALQDANPLGIWRVVDEKWTRDSIPQG